MVEPNVRPCDDEAVEYREYDEPEGEPESMVQEEILCALDRLTDCVIELAQEVRQLREGRR